jgi:hypothetical protein
LDVELRTRIANKENDEKDGIYHLTYGQDRGIVRRINFKRVEDRRRRTALLEQNNGFSNVAQHSERYNATIEMEGNGIFQPGMSVFINPYISSTINHARTSKLINVLGLGGYYWIKSVSTAYVGTLFDTEIECIWTSEGTADASREINSATNKKNSPKANPNTKHQGPRWKRRRQSKPP